MSGLAFLRKYKKLIFYSVDPGSYSVFQAIINILNQENLKLELYCEGWALEHATLSKHNIDQLQYELTSLESKQDSLFIVGSQTNFSKTQYWLSFAKEAEVNTLFIFDHWKNYSAHFMSADIKKITIPNYFFVPDTLAKNQLLLSLEQTHLVNIEDLYQNIIISGHFGVDAYCKKVHDVPALEKVKLLKELGENDRKVILLLLDPDETNSELYPGYNTESIIKYLASYIAGEYISHKIIVKPHPRDEIHKLKLLIEKYWGFTVNWIIVGDEKLERLLSIADEVWGVTTVGLIIAQKVGKPIKSFQINRNAIGETQSNDIIEPYVII